MSANTPCCVRAAAAAVNVPGAPAAPPGSTADAVTGALDLSFSAAGMPDSDGSAISTTEPPGMSMPVAPVGS